MKSIKLGIIIGALAIVAGLINTNIAGEAIAWLNNLWGQGLEAVMGTVGLATAVYAYTMPRYVAVALHDGKAWLDIQATWTTARGGRGDTVQFMKGEAALMLGQQFLKTTDADFPADPQPVLYSINLWGARRGIYWIIPVQVLSTALLEKHGRWSAVGVKYDHERNHPPLW